MSFATEMVIDIIKERRKSVWYLDVRELGIAQWADEELIERLQKQNFTPPLHIIESFMNKLEEFEKLDDRNRDIFEMAHFEVENIIDLILST